MGKVLLPRTGLLTVLSEETLHQQCKLCIFGMCVKFAISFIHSFAHICIVFCWTVIMHDYKYASLFIDDRIIYLGSSGSSAHPPFQHGSKCTTCIATRVVTLVIGYTRLCRILPPEETLASSWKSCSQGTF